MAKIQEFIQEHTNKINALLELSGEELNKEFEKHKVFYQIIQQEPAATAWDFKIKSIAGLWKELEQIRRALQDPDIREEEATTTMIKGKKRSTEE